MAKKSKKVRAKSKVAVASPFAGSGSLPASSISRQIASRPVAAAVQPQNYSYVKSDLVQIGIIVAVLLIIMVVLSFVPSLRS